MSDPGGSAMVVHVVLDNGPRWVQYLIAFGTAGAAIFAGWAAVSARESTSQARALIELEQTRDHRAEDQARWHQARRLSIDLSLEGVTLEDGREAIDSLMVVSNLSVDPLFRCRLKMVAGGATWGPQLVGTLRPGQPVQLIARLIPPNDFDPTTELNALARVNDAQGNAWIVDAKGNVTPDDAAGLDRWIDEGRAAATRPMSLEERGTIEGATYEPAFDFQQWRDHLEALRTTAE